MATTDIGPLARFIPGDPPNWREFFLAAAGVAPYRLLAHLSGRFAEQAPLVEVGVHNGWGSLALGFDKRTGVVGYDIELGTLSAAIRDENPNLVFKEGLAHELDPHQILASPLIHFDALHDGVYEATFLRFLTDGGYHGWLLLDDIHLNGAMQRFWDSITAFPKWDLTHIGHSTGTGLVGFAHQKVLLS